MGRGGKGRVLLTGAEEQPSVEPSNDVWLSAPVVPECLCQVKDGDKLHAVRYRNEEVHRHPEVLPPPKLHTLEGLIHREPVLQHTLPMKRAPGKLAESSRQQARQHLSKLPSPASTPLFSIRAPPQQQNPLPTPLCSCLLSIYTAAQPFDLQVCQFSNQKVGACPLSGQSEVSLRQLRSRLSLPCPRLLANAAFRSKEQGSRPALPRREGLFSSSAH